MKKYVIILLGLFTSFLSFSQEYHYQFKLESVENYGQAKYAIVELRELLGVRIIKFNDTSDEFLIITHLDYIIEELIYDMESIGFDLNGIITKSHFE